MLDPNKHIGAALPGRLGGKQPKRVDELGPHAGRDTGGIADERGHKHGELPTSAAVLAKQPSQRSVLLLGEAPISLRRQVECARHRVVRRSHRNPLRQVPQQLAHGHRNMLPLHLRLEVTQDDVHPQRVLRPGRPRHHNDAVDLDRRQRQRRRKRHVRTLHHQDAGPTLLVSASAARGPHGRDVGGCRAPENDGFGDRDCLGAVAERLCVDLDNIIEPEAQGERMKRRAPHEGLQPQRVVGRTLGLRLAPDSLGRRGGGARGRSVGGDLLRPATLRPLDLRDGYHRSERSGLLKACGRGHPGTELVHDRRRDRGDAARPVAGKQHLHRRTTSIAPSEQVSQRPMMLGAERARACAGDNLQGRCPPANAAYREPTMTLVKHLP